MFPVDSINKSSDREALDSVDSKEKDKSADLTEGDTTAEEDFETEAEDSESDSKDEEDIEPEEDESKDAKSDEEESDDEVIDENDSLYQQIQKASPKLLKEIPELKRVIFREAAYTEIFPTVEEAKESQRTAEVFQNFQQDIIEGNVETLLVAIEKTDKSALQNFVANFIPAVQQQSKELYLEMLYPEFKKLFRAAAKSGDERLKVSAENLNYFLFQDSDLDKDIGLKPAKKDEKEEKLSKREQEFEERIYKSFAQDVGSVTKGRAIRFISQAFRDSGISEWQQKKLTEDIFLKVDGIIQKDPRHQGVINQLWRQARQAGFTSEWKDRISNTYLSRAKLLIPKARQAVLSEAKVNAKINEGKDDKKRPTRIASGTSTQNVSSNRKIEAKNIDWTKTSERDLLEGKFVERK